MNKVYKLAVIGKDVSKSDSAKMHTFDFRGLGSECTFDLLSVAKENFDEYAKKLIAEYDAFCVTIPYKLDIIPYLDKIVGDAEMFGAVNVVKDKIGYNTDGVGFMLMLEINGIDPKGKKILVLGAGGAGRSVIKKLADAGADVYALRRHHQRYGRGHAQNGGDFPRGRGYPFAHEIRGRPHLLPAQERVSAHRGEPRQADHERRGDALLPGVLRRLHRFGQGTQGGRSGKTVRGI